MKKSILFFVATMLVSGTLLAQSDTLRLDRIRVVFPGKVQVEEQGPAKRCQLRLADSSANFQVISIDLSTMGLDETTAIAMQPKRPFGIRVEMVLLPNWDLTPSSSKTR